MNKLAQFISIITHPILLPTWMFLIIIISGLCEAAYINATLCLAIVFFSTFVLPLGFILILKRFGVINSLSMEKREDRFAPLFIMFIFLFATTRLFNDIDALSIFNYYLICDIVLCALVFWINMYWKISMHTIGWGAFVGMLFIMSTASMKVYTPYLIISIIFSGIVASARLYLKSHSNAQIYTGFAVGFIFVFITYLFQLT